MDTTQQYPPSYLAENIGWQLIDVAIAFGVLETIFAILFFVSRYLNKTMNGLDFYLMPPSFIMCFSHVIVSILFVKYGGGGRHVVALSPETFITWLKLELVEEFIFRISTSLPKLAILCLYERIFTTRICGHVISLTALVIILSCIVEPIVFLVLCRPFAYNWNKTIPGGHCGDVEATYRWVNISNLATDVVILILPLHVVWHLQTGIGNKIGLTLTFLTGCIGILTSIVRLVVFFNVVDFYTDSTHNVKIGIWTTIEPGVYFIAATLPSLRPLLHHLFKNIHFRTFFTRLHGYYSRTFTRNRNTSEIPLAGLHSTPAATGMTTKIAGSSGARSAGFKKLDEHNNQKSNISPNDENDFKMLHTFRERWEDEEANRFSERPQFFSARYKSTK